MKKKYALWESIGSPKYALAPMVDVNDLPFRRLVRKYGTTLTFTEMKNAKSFMNPKMRERLISDYNSSLDYPCFIQFAGCDPELLLACARHVEKITPCVDLNLGCPQKVAKSGHYGSFLLDHPDEVYKIVGYLCNNKLACGVSCKIRLFNDLNKTYELCRKLEELGIDVLTVHGRTKEQNKEKVGKCNWEAVKNIKKMLHIPVICNGGLGSFEDIDKCFEETKVDCVMSGEKLMEMPTFFSKKLYDIDDIALEYLESWKDFEEVNIGNIRGHAFKFYFQATKMDANLNQRLGSAKSLEEFISLGKEIKEMRKDVKLEDKYIWYNRHTYKKENKDKLTK